MDTKFFTFIKPYLSYIDSGDIYRKPFNWIYTLFAIINLVIPIYVFYEAAYNHVFDASAKFIFVFLLLWLIIAFASWVSFQLWWDRKVKVIKTSNGNDRFVATPVFSHFIQTLGEWLGTWIGIVGFGTALLTTIVLGKDGRYFSSSLGFGFLQSGWTAIIRMPLFGFFIIVLTRFLAEQFNALASIANNTKKQ